MWRLAVHAVGFPDRLRKVLEVVIAQSFAVDWEIGIWPPEPHRRADALVVLIGDRWPLGMPVPLPGAVPKWTAELRVGDYDQLRGLPLTIARNLLFSQLTQTLVSVGELLRQHQGNIPKTAEAALPASPLLMPDAVPAALAMVVDQSTQAQQLISAELTAMGFSVLCAQDADQALDIARSRVLTLAIIDTDLPGTMDGISLGRILRVHATTPVSVLMLTNHGGSRERLRALVSGTQAYLVKPVDRLMFRTEIHRLLALARVPNQIEPVH